MSWKSRIRILVSIVVVIAIALALRRTLHSHLSRTFVRPLVSADLLDAPLFEAPVLDDALSVVWQRLSGRGSTARSPIGVLRLTSGRIAVVDVAALVDSHGQTAALQLSRPLTPSVSAVHEAELDGWTHNWIRLTDAAPVAWLQGDLWTDDSEDVTGGYMCGWCVLVDADAFERGLMFDVVPRDLFMRQRSFMLDEGAGLTAVTLGFDDQFVRLYWGLSSDGEPAVLLIRPRDAGQAISIP